MSFSDAIKTCLSKYASVSGRARRSEYWYFVLFNVLISFITYFSAILFAFAESDGLTYLFTGLYILAGFAFLVPSICVTIRRLHDTGRSGWNLLWYLVPIAGPFVLLVFLVSDSKLGPNQWGPNPKGEECYWQQPQQPQQPLEQPSEQQVD